MQCAAFSMQVFSLNSQQTDTGQLSGKAYLGKLAKPTEHSTAHKNSLTSAEDEVQEGETCGSTLISPPRTHISI